MDLILRPIRLISSKPARRAYVQTFLLILTTIVLLFVAVTSYAIFYASYIPSIGISKPVHFYYAPTASPSGHLYFAPSELIQGQHYDITLRLRLPASPANMDHGNFNCDLFVLDYAGLLTMRSPHFSGELMNGDVQDAIILHARRPGILTYTSPLLRTLHTLALSPLLVTGLARQEETLRIALAERATFDREPKSAVIELDPGMAVYEAKLEFVARLRGLRWFMYSWRITAAAVFIALFWGTEVMWAVLVWYRVSSWLAARKIGLEGETDEGEKEEEEEGESDEVVRFEDVQRTFPTSSRAPALRPVQSYPTPESTPAPEDRQGSGGGDYASDSDESRAGDDEEEEGEDEKAVDSGLGTTMSESTARERNENVRRRQRSRSGGGGGGR